MDHSDFGRTYNQYYRLVMRAAENFIDDFHYQEDVCQEVFVKLYRNLGELDEDYVRPWLLVVTRNTALDLRRKLKLDGPGGEEPTDLENFETPSMMNNPEREIVASESRTEVFDALRKKNPEWLFILLRLEVDGVSQSDLAREMGVSLPILRNKIYRARKWLKKSFPKILSMLFLILFNK